MSTKDEKCRSLKDLSHSIHKGKIVCNGHFCDLDGTEPE